MDLAALRDRRRRRLLQVNNLGSQRPIPLIAALLRSGAILDRGTGSPSFTRAAVASVRNNEATPIACASGEIRFEGSLRWENLAKNHDVATWSFQTNCTVSPPMVDPDTGKTFWRVTADLANAVCAHQQTGLTTGHSMVASLYMRRVVGTGEVQEFQGTNSAVVSSLNTDIVSPALSDAFQRIKVSPADATSTSGYYGIVIRTAGDVIDVYGPELDDVEGEISGNGFSALPYLSVGALSAPYHGANVDGVAYSQLTHLNTAAATGDSFTSATGQFHYPEYMAQSNASAYVQSAGFSGQTLPQIAGHYDASVHPLSFRVLFVQGGINSVIQGDTLEDMQDAVTELIDKGLADGAIVKVINIAPFKGTDFWTQPRQDLVDAYNEWLAENLLERAADGDDTELVDLDALVADPANPDYILAEYGSGVSSDLHLSFRGYGVLGLLCSAALGDGVDFFITPANGGDAAVCDARGPFGYLAELERINHFLNSDTPVTQTSASLGTGTYTLWLDGSGSIAVAGNTATITGAGTATSAAAVTFTVTVAGTVDYTVTGPPTRAQAENGAFRTSYIKTAGSPVTRPIDVLGYGASNIPTNDFVVAIDWAPIAASMGTVFLWGTYVDANNYTAILHDGTNLIARKRIAGTNRDATIALAYSKDTAYRVRARFSSTSGVDIFNGATKGTNNANTTAAQIGTTLQIGCDGNGASSGCGRFRDFAAYGPLTDAGIAGI